VILKASSSTKYYSVRGTTPGAIFDDIKRNGLFDSKNRPAVGLTSGEVSIDWNGIETQPLHCTSGTMTITVTLVITLPQHNQLNDLSEDVRTNWQRFAARVAAHEQRHADTYLNGAKALKTRLETALMTVSPCEHLKNRVRSIWFAQQAEIEEQQDQFHVDDEAKIRNDQKPLQAEVDVNQARLAAITSDMRDLEQTLAGLKPQHDALQTRIDAVKAEMATSHASPANCSQSQFTTPEIQTLCQQYRTLIVAHNTLVDRHNEAASRGSGLADEYNRLVAITNGLIEALNWMR
jgi:predicted secreted Zn-dependent protease